MLVGGQGTKWHRKIVKILTCWIGYTSITDRQTDDRQTAYIEREREFAKKVARRPFQGWFVIIALAGQPVYYV